jgi:hypothetical protein
MAKTEHPDISVDYGASSRVFVGRSMNRICLSMTVRGHDEHVVLFRWSSNGRSKRMAVELLAPTAGGEALASALHGFDARGCAF